MNREQIEDEVKDLMTEYGPDGHIDGYKEITDFIIELLNKKTEIDGNQEHKDNL